MWGDYSYEDCQLHTYWSTALSKNLLTLNQLKPAISKNQLKPTLSKNQLKPTLSKNQKSLCQQLKKKKCKLFK